MEQIIKMDESRKAILLNVLQDRWISLTKALPSLDDAGADIEYINELSDQRDTIQEWVTEVNGELTQAMMDFKIKNNICW